MVGGERKERGRSEEARKTRIEVARTSGERACKGVVQSVVYNNRIYIYIYYRSPCLIDLKPSRNTARVAIGDADATRRGVTWCRIGAANGPAGYRMGARERARSQTIRMRKRKREDKRKE